jgi:GrpB-like predicted nucleotidyltransferase (UPF0157 family)
MAQQPVAAELIGGVEKREIIVVDYDSRWPQKFKTHAIQIAVAVGSAAHHIDHVGSTSVPGLAAKPIIDILLVVENSADEARYLPQLEAAGYVLRVREPEWHEHRMLRTPDRDVHIHVFSDGCEEVTRLLTFRDRLRSDECERRRYETTKRQLAVRDWADMNEYAAAKSGVIEEVLAAARANGQIGR